MADRTGHGPHGDPGNRVRIGDAEREEVLTALQEHLAAGRLTVEEYEERAERAVAARFGDELGELLTDMPPTTAQQERRRAEAPRWRGRQPLPLPLLVGLALLVIIALPGPPFLLFPLLLFGAFFALGRRGGGWDRRGGWGRGRPGPHGCRGDGAWNHRHHDGRDGDRWTDDDRRTDEDHWPGAAPHRARGPVV